MKKPSVSTATKRACENLKATLANNGYELRITDEECSCLGFIRGKIIMYSKPMNAHIELKTILTLLHMQRSGDALYKKAPHLKKNEYALFDKRARIEMNDDNVLLSLELLVSTTLNQMMDEYRAATEAA